MNSSERQDRTHGPSFTSHLDEDTATEAHSMRVHGLVDVSSEDGIHRGGISDETSDSRGHGGRIPFESTPVDTEGHTAKVHGVLDDRDDAADDTTGHIGNHKF
jgi:hypothetical protein